MHNHLPVSLCAYQLVSLSFFQSIYNQLRAISPKADLPPWAHSGGCSRVWTSGTWGGRRAWPGSRWQAWAKRAGTGAACRPTRGRCCDPAAGTRTGRRPALGKGSPGPARLGRPSNLQRALGSEPDWSFFRDGFSLSSRLRSKQWSMTIFRIWFRSRIRPWSLILGI